jgi:hypothetical protein
MVLTVSLSVILLIDLKAAFHDVDFRNEIRLNAFHVIDFRQTEVVLKFVRVRTRLTQGTLLHSVDGKKTEVIAYTEAASVDYHTDSSHDFIDENKHRETRT